MILVLSTAVLFSACAGGGGAAGSTTSKPTYIVIYSGNGSTGGLFPIDSTTYVQGQTVTVIGNSGNFVKVGYSFSGWNTQADGSGTTYTQGQTFMMGSANVTLYARWTTNPTYTVTYNGNGNTSGIVPVSSTNYEQGQTVTVLGNTGNLVETNYSFLGWNTQADGSGTTYTQGQTFTMGAANVTLYAVWTETSTYTVTYNGNSSTDGIVPVDSTNYEQGQTVTVLGNTGNLVKTNYSFSGWNTQANGTGTTYTQGQTFMVGVANVTLYAVWTATTTYTVTYVGNGNTGGIVPVNSTNYAQGQTVTVLGNTGNLVYTGYSFAGWNTQANGTGTTYTQAQTFAMGSANVTLYARWTTNPTYTVTYNGNGSTGGSVPVDSDNYEQGQIVTVLGNTGNLVETNYSFVGWNTQADGSGTTYTQGQTFTMGVANVNLYAVWTANPTYTVTYNGNGNTGGSVPADSNNYEQGQTVTVLGNAGNLVETNYSFLGWNTQANGSGTTYMQGQTFTMGTANVTLYAVWTASSTHTVTYNGNGSTGGIVPIDSTNYTQGQTVTVLGNTGNLVYTGYSFAGWNTQANGTGTTYTQGQTFAMGTANVTLYAVWTLAPLSAPAGVTAKSGNGQAVIVWSAVQGALSYNVYWSTTAANATKLSGFKFAGVTSPFTHAGLTNGLTYYYTVTAVNANMESVDSTVVSAMPKVVTLVGGSVQGIPLNIAGLVSTLVGYNSIGSTLFTNMTTDGANLYVADRYNNKIYKIAISTGAITTIAGNGFPGYTNGIGTAASFNIPWGITTDGTNLYVADYNNCTIRQIVISTGLVTTLAGTEGVIGSTNGTGATASFDGPTGITTDGTNLYVLDNGSAIRKIVIATGVVTTLVAPADFLAYGITTDGTNLYVADFSNFVILKYVIATGVVSTLAGDTGNAGCADGTGTAANFYYPFGITTDGTNLYVTDSVNMTIREIVISTGQVITLAGTAPQSGCPVGIIPTVNFSIPYGITTNGINLYVADEGTESIWEIQ